MAATRFRHAFQQGAMSATLPVGVLAQGRMMELRIEQQVETIARLEARPRASRDSARHRRVAAPMKDSAGWTGFGRRFVPQHEAKRLPGECERVLEDAQRARCRVGVTVAGDEAVDQRALLRHARFEFREMPPRGGFHGPIHSITPRH